MIRRELKSQRDARLADKPMTVRPIKSEAVTDAGPSVYTSHMAPLKKGQLAMSDIHSVYDKAPSSKNVLDLDEITIDKMQCPLVHAGQCVADVSPSSHCKATDMQANALRSASSRHLLSTAPASPCEWT